MTTTPIPPFYPYQKEALKALWAYWKEKPRGVPLIVAPTGSGKSLICSGIIQLYSHNNPYLRVLVVSHVQEILEQNKADLSKWMPNERLGVYSTGLGIKRIGRITFAGIQSIYKKPEMFAGVDLVIVDECHLIPPNDNSMYQKLIQGLYKGNGNVKIVGLTATPYRMDQGSLISGTNIFTDIAYDIPIRELIEQGYLSPVISKPRESVDLSKVRTTGYDYNQGDLEFEFNKDSLVHHHCQEMIRLGENRKSWLIFCSGVKHAENTARILTELGIPADFISGDLLQLDRQQRIERFKRGELRALTNCNVLTTGFNHPAVDMLVLLRATKSTGLYVQCVGRGTRKAANKLNCLVLDYGGNINRHGPIDCIEVRANKGSKKASVKSAPVKECPICGAVTHISAKECLDCGHQFAIIQRIDTKHSEAPILSELEQLEVTNWSAKIHNKADKPPMLKIEYQCGPKWVLDFLCFEHGGYATTMARKKWVQRGGQLPVPTSTQEAYQRLTELPTPTQLTTKKEGKYDRILKIAYKTIEESLDSPF